MPRELRISAVVTLPDGLFEAAAAIVHAKPFMESIREKFPDVAVTFEIVTPKPRGSKQDASAPDSNAE